MMTTVTTFLAQLSRNYDKGVYNYIISFLMIVITYTVVY